MRSTAHWGIAALVGLGLLGCAHVPASGPSRSAVFDAGTGDAPPFMLVEIDEAVLGALVRWPIPSLVGRFGDYRASLDQRIDVGDSLAVTVYEAASGGLFSNPNPTPTSPGAHTATIPEQVVARDGAITMPYAGRVRVVGKTPPEVEAAIVARLIGKAIEPQVIVSLTKSVGSTVTLTGDATAGTRVPLGPHGDRLLDVIAGAGGVRAPVTETFIALTRGGRTARVPMGALLTDPRENIFARPGDILTLVRYPLTFAAVGATLKNAVVPFDGNGLSLAEALAKAGGLVDERADPDGIFLLRYEPEGLCRTFVAEAAMPVGALVPVAYHLNLREPGALLRAQRFQIHDKDILYVANSPVSDLTKVLTVVNLVTSPVVSGALVGATLK